MNKSSYNPTNEMLCDIYDALHGVDITDSVLQVVMAVVEFVYSKNLNNTMRKRCESRSKKFKCQLRFLLNAVGKGRLYV